MPDLIIIIDEMMPNMDGCETPAELKEHPSTHGIKVMRLTDMERPREASWAMEMGAYDCVVKQVRIKEFQDSVKCCRVGG